MRRFRKILFIVLAIVGVVIGYRVLAVYQFRSVACAPRAARPPEGARQYPERLLVMTYNIQGHASLMKPRHIEEIAAAINQVKPDIVGINEAHRGTWQARFGDHVAALQRLTGMRAAYGPSYKLWGGEYGNLVLTRGEIVSSDIHELPGTGEPRTLLETVIRIDGTNVSFFVTHLAAWASVNARARAEQLQCLQEYVTTSRYPFVLVGDINASPAAEEVAAFIRANHVELIGSANDSTHKVMNERIDLIFATPRWKAGSVRTLDIGPSDHRPVVAELLRP